MPVRVNSEIGPLRRVLVHTPGPELLAVTPGTREHYLYDDIMDVGAAQREHECFVAVLERFAEVHRVRDLLLDVVERAEVREMFHRETGDVVTSEPVARALVELPPPDLVRMLIEGREEEPGPLARTLNETGYAFPPVPNLFFTRDVAMVIGDRVMIGSMRYGARWSEELIMKVLFTHHPALANRGVLYDGSNERRLNYTLEGGDVHVLRSDVLLIGFSERSSPAAIDNLASLLFATTPIEHIIIVVMPSENTAIHLDMIFTQVDHGLCAVYPPHFIGPERLSILHWRRGEQQTREMPDLFAALRAAGVPMEPVFVGGRRRVFQEREQWASGGNFCALRPGVVTAYSRNEATLREMETAGFRIITATDLLAERAAIPDGGRAVVTFEGGELVRGGGGPRCMTCVVEREDVE